jgi:hypothetical protein
MANENNDKRIDPNEVQYLSEGSFYNTAHKDPTPPIKFTNLTDIASDDD